jgi:hypothetical protein
MVDVREVGVKADDVTVRVAQLRQGPRTNVLGWRPSD